MPEMNETSQGFLPNFCSMRVLFLVVLVAELLAIVISLVGSAPGGGRLFDLAMNSLFIQWITLSSVALLCVCRNKLARLSNLNASLVAWGLILLVTAVIAELSWYFVSSSASGRPLPGGSHLEFSLRVVITAGIVAAIYLRHLYINYQWHRSVEARALSRLQALQARIRPHFLFNCLNSIAGMISHNPGDAERAVEDLADLIRVSLDEQRNLVLLRDEFALCQQYLHIETLRLGKRLRVQWAVEDLADTAHIPQLTLQPLLENAIYHGLELLESGGTIRIEATRAGSGYYVLVANTHDPGRTGSRHGSGHSLAIENIRRRLQTIYGRAARLETVASESEYQVRLFIPRLSLSSGELARIFEQGTG